MKRNNITGEAAAPGPSRRGFGLSLLSAFGLGAVAPARALGPDPVSIKEAAYYEPLGPKVER